MSIQLNDYLHDALDKVAHISTVEAFYHHFQAIKSLLAASRPEYPESYFATRFTYRLLPDFQAFVLRFNPHTVMAAYRLALIYEESLYLDYFPEPLMQIDEHEFKNVVEDNTLVIHVSKDIVVAELPSNSIYDSDISCCSPMEDLASTSKPLIDNSLAGSIEETVADNLEGGYVVDEFMVEITVDGGNNADRSVGGVVRVDEWSSESPNSIESNWPKIIEEYATENFNYGPVVCQLHRNPCSTEKRMDIMQSKVLLHEVQQRDMVSSGLDRGEVETAIGAFAVALNIQNIRASPALHVDRVSYRIDQANSWPSSLVMDSAVNEDFIAKVEVRIAWNDIAINILSLLFDRGFITKGPIQLKPVFSQYTFSDGELTNSLSSITKFMFSVTMNAKNEGSLIVFSSKCFRCLMWVIWSSIQV